MSSFTSICDQRSISWLHKN